MNYTASSLFFISIALAGCSGVKFAPAPVNATMPPSFTKRAIYPSAVAGYEFEKLAGTILSIEPGKDPLRVGIIRSQNKTPIAIPITESLNYYHSRIQQGASGGGQYLAFAAKLSADELVDFALDDISRASTDYTEDVISKISAWVKTHPKPNGTSRVWVQSVVLSRQTLTNFVKIEANATGQIGEVTGVQTGVYRKSDGAVRSTILGFDAFDVDQLVAQTEAAPKGAKLSNAILEQTRSIMKIPGKLQLDEK